jgi:hypothetical protein
MEKAAGLAALEACDGNLLLASKQTGIPRITLMDWKQQQERGDTRLQAVEILQPVARGMLADLFEAEAHAALQEASEKRAAANYQQLITGSAICVDKMRLLRDQATAIHAQQLTDEERLVRLNELMATALSLPEQPALPEGEEASDDVG